VVVLAAVRLLQVVAQLSLLAQPPQVLVLLAKDVVVRVQLLLLVQPQPLALPVKDVVVRVLLLLLAQPPQEAAVAQEAVHLLTRSFSAAMAGILPSPEPLMYAPAPRSRWKPKHRPCPLT
jgi:hypothetical protein